MDRPKIDKNTELSQARRLHNSGDIDAYKSPSRADRMSNDINQERIERDRAAFHRRGGKVVKIAPGVSGYDANKMPRHIVINPKKMGKH